MLMILGAAYNLTPLTSPIMFFIAFSRQNIIFLYFPVIACVITYSGHAYIPQLAPSFS